MNKLRCNIQETW